MRIMLEPNATFFFVSRSRSVRKWLSLWRPFQWHHIDFAICFNRDASHGSKRCTMKVCDGDNAIVDPDPVYLPVAARSAEIDLDMSIGLYRYGGPTGQFLLSQRGHTCQWLQPRQDRRLANTASGEANITTSCAMRSPIFALRLKIISNQKCPLSCQEVVDRSSACLRIPLNMRLWSELPQRAACANRI